MDSKQFSGALADFDEALRLTPAAQQLDRARLLSGRGLAYEGISARSRRGCLRLPAGAPAC